MLPPPVGHARAEVVRYAPQRCQDIEAATSLALVARCQVLCNIDPGLEDVGEDGRQLAREHLLLDAIHFGLKIGEHSLGFSLVEEGQWGGARSMGPKPCEWGG
jgi:hypothetical protein